MEKLKQFCIDQGMNLPKYKEKMQKILIVYEFLCTQEPKKWTMRELLSEISNEYFGFTCTEATLLNLVKFLEKNNFIEDLQHEKYQGYFLKAKVVKNKRT
jgi:Tfp pilus assembly protein PilO